MSQNNFVFSCLFPTAKRMVNGFILTIYGGELFPSPAHRYIKKDFRFEVSCSLAVPIE